MSLFDDPKFKALLDHFSKHGLPGMASSAMSVVILTDHPPDPKLCLEIGAAVLLDKPIIVTCARGTVIPANLKRVATSIVEAESMMSEEMKTKLEAAINELLANDARVKRPQ
jgi:hypothetical protein